MEQSLFKRALSVLPGGAQGTLRREFHSISPLVVSRARGPRLWTIDGQELVDFHMAFGAVVLGHSDPDVVKAVSEQASRLILHGAGVSDVEVEYAELITSLIPGARGVVFTVTGSEAVMLAFRAARAATGKNIIVKFEGNYHGWHDYSLYNVRNPISKAGKKAESGGIPSQVASTVEVLPYNDIEALRSFMYERGDKVAAIIMEPVAHSMGVVPARKEFVREAERLARTYGALLIFDEVITGVRVSLRGLQEYYGVRVDMTILGKGIANGLPVAALVVNEDVFNLFEEGVVVASGTYASHPLSMAGGLAALRKAVKLDLDKVLWRIATEASKAVGDALSDARVTGAVSQFGGSFSLHLGLKEPPRNLEEALKADLEGYRKLVAHLRRTGILVSPNPLKRFHVSASHGSDEIEALYSAVKSALKNIFTRSS
ncbi:MAG: aspartate aminotransferase family protein [Desulfurococcales archaeon]|nr:aspartate aminotransferase family protein [Desulfurococcales archaeon]